jgi:hypothetical protein
MKGRVAVAKKSKIFLNADVIFSGLFAPFELFVYGP